MQTDLVEIGVLDPVERIFPGGGPQAHHGADHRQGERQEAAGFCDAVGDFGKLFGPLPHPCGQKFPGLLGRQHLDLTLFRSKVDEDLSVAGGDQEPPSGSHDVEKRSMVDLPHVVQDQKEGLILESASEKQLSLML